MSKWTNTKWLKIKLLTCLNHEQDGLDIFVHSGQFSS
jgi:hypothetical protein